MSFFCSVLKVKKKKPISPVLVGTIKEWIIFLHFSSQVCVRCKTSFLWWADLILVAKRAWRIVTHLTQWQKCGPAAHPSTSVCQFSFMFWNDFDICKTLNAWFTMYIVSRLCLGRHQAAVCELNGFVYVIGGAESWNCLNSVERYNPANNTWTLVAPMNVARRGAGVVCMKVRRLVFKGIVHKKHQQLTLRPSKMKINLFLHWNFNITWLACQWILCSEWVPSRMRVQTADKNIVIHMTPVHQLTSCEKLRVCKKQIHQ